MSRAVRITVGSVMAGVLVLVALVAGAMAAGSSVGPGFLDDLSTEGLDSTATAEVVDVDGGYGWPTVDVRWTTPDGEVVVTWVDWDWAPDLPAVGEEVEVVYDPADPEYAFAADDPWVAGAAGLARDGGDGARAQEEAPADDDGPGRVAGWVALAALLGVLVTAAVTVVAAVRAPSPRDRGHQPVGPGQPYAGQPYAGQPYPGQPYAGQPYPGQPYATPLPWAAQPSPGEASDGRPSVDQAHAGRPGATDAGAWSSPG